MLVLFGNTTLALGAPSEKPGYPSTANFASGMTNIQYSPKTLLQEKVDKAIGLIDTRISVLEGIRLLQDASREGSDEARYTLGWLYMQDAVFPKNYDIAFEYLSKIHGDYKTAAKILIGVIYAEGSEKIVVDRNKAGIIFNEVARSLNDEMKIFQLSEPRTERDVKSRQRWQENGAVLSGFAREYGITINAGIGKENKGENNPASR
jgi:TPR repeat protein